MKEISKFQLILLGIFVVAIFAAVITLALYKGNSKTNVSQRITIWGTMSSERFDSFLNNGVNNKTINAGYSQKPPNRLYQDLLEALASGAAPDVLFLTQEELYSVRSKILPIPYTSYPQLNFKQTFIEGAEIFANDSGIEAIPALVDPLVMYWNRDIFNEHQYTKPPEHWDEFYDFATKVSRHDKDLNIIKSAVSFGEFVNVNNAKDIFNTLIYQAGGKITERRDTSFVSTLNQGFNNPRNPAQSSIDFYMQFSDPLKPVYSWNRTLSSSKDEFLAGDLAVYFGYASEIDEIRAKNPNLNFDVAFMPQTRGASSRMTHGKFYGFSFVRNTPRIADALAGVVKLTRADTIERVIGRNDYFPVRRDMLGASQAKADKSIFYTSAFYARTWIDPNPQQTSNIFRELISMISSGRLSTSDAISRANDQIQGLLR